MDKIINAIKHISELHLYSARLAEKEFVRGSALAGSALVEVAKSFGAISALHQLCLEFGLTDQAEEARSIRERIEEIYNEIQEAAMRAEG